MNTNNERQALQPTIGIADPDFQYEPSCGTNIARTFERFGYVPPDREKQRRTRLQLLGINAADARLVAG